MSLSSILQRVQNKGKLPVKPVNEANEKSKQNTSNEVYSRPIQREVDPVVARLKEKRRQENEMKMKLAREKKGLSPVKPKQQKVGKQSQSQSQSQVQIPARSRTSKLPIPTSGLKSAPAPIVQKPVAKKLKFNDLMKKASKIDQSSLSIKLRQKTQSPDSLKTTSKSNIKPVHSSNLPQTSRSMSPPNSKSVDSRKITSNRQRDSISPQVNEPRSKAPIPIRKPSTTLQQKLKVKKPVSNSKSSRSYDNDQDSYESDEELDDFIVSDEEEVAEPVVDYDRDEIWAMFNKGKKRSHFSYDDYDSDDMEATGAEILDEEYRSRRTAEIEDRREAMEEARLAALKQAKKRKK